MKSFLIEDLLQLQEKKELAKKEVHETNINSVQTFLIKTEEKNKIDNFNATVIPSQNKEFIEKYINDFTEAYSKTNLLLFKHSFETAMNKMAWCSTYTEIYNYLLTLNKKINSFSKTSFIDKTDQEPKIWQTEIGTVSRNMNYFEQNNSNIIVPLFPCINSFYYNAPCQPIKTTRKCRRSRTVFTEVQVCDPFFV